MGTLGVATLDTSVDLTGLDKGLTDADSRSRTVFGGMGSAAGSAFAAVGTAAVTGAAVAGAAVIGFGAKATTAFIDFQSGMNEVFTLMPGASAEAMGAMSDGVKDLARDFGVMPEEVIPALYQSLSAGVPPDNVFSFLETANKAAIGGVTDLETAVDGISSVVNAYGSDVMDAAHASDVMFTTVRLGKTDFGQLSASLFNVIPTASALGVSFEDVGAAMATVTAQGVPTSVATTQLRQLLVELSKSGGKAASTFEDMAGSSFKEFIASGGNVQDALQLMEQAAADSGVGLQDMFGSVEAGNAALALTGANADTFSDALEEMQNAAGATDGAFEQMDGGLNRSIERMKAFGQTVLLDVGEALSPLIGIVLSLAEAALPKIQEVLNGTVIPAIQTVAGLFRSFFLNLEEGMSPIDSFIEAIWDIAPQPVLDALVNLRDNIFPAITEWFQTSVQPIIDAVAGFVSWKDVLIALGVAIGAAVLPVVISLVTAIASFAAPIVAVIAIVAVLRNAWENNWGGIQDKLKAAWAVIQPVLAAVWEWLKTNIPIALETLRAWWVDTVWPAIQNAISVVWPIIQQIFQALVAFVTDTIIPTVTTLYTKWTQEWWPTIQTVLENTWTVIETIFTEVGRWINDNLVPWVQFLHDTWVDEVWPAIQTALETVWEVIEPIWEAIRAWLEETIPPALEAFQTTWETVMAALEGPINTVKETWDKLVDAVEGFWDWLSSKVFSFNFSIPDLPDWATPGSPIPLHTAWKAFADDMRQQQFVFPAGANQQGAAAYDLFSSDLQYGGTTTQTVINIDARGAAPGVEYAIEDIVRRLLNEYGAQADFKIRMS